ncbi:MAG: hypothetical protein CMG66_04940 [Candidatus Marinimicrobia bacterium]|jgi:hypothetical protein|nr:hypothetical protein [Candidatus Neomarinimicrobiota bacterium]|tara:strand:- start:3548 stop:3997 length:450 start_codon:yes stop_codon:yes gene_type:complete
MKNTITYLLSIVLIIIGVYYIKTTYNTEPNQTSIQNQLSKSGYVRAEIEVLNGCGESGVANLFTKFLRAEEYDVIEIKNADKFDYQETTILYHKKDMQKKAKRLSNLLDVKDSNVKFNKDSVWDLSVIIGNDYKELNSFEKIKNFYELF